MPEEKLEEPHILSVKAAELIHSTNDRLGIWDFEKVFRPYILLIEKRAAAAEVASLSSSDTAQEGRKLYLFKRGCDLHDEIRLLEKQLKLRHA